MLNFAGLFGGDESSSADTITNTTNNTTTRDIGLTGQNAVDALLFINQTTFEGLKGLGNTVASTYDKSFDFGKYVMGTSADIFNQSTARVSESLANITNAARDISQRNIASSVGQAVPIQDIPAATASVPTNSKSGVQTWLIVGAVAIAGFFLLKGK